MWESHTFGIVSPLIICLYSLVYNQKMKPLPAPEIPGKTEFQKFDNAVRQVLTVSKEELFKREEREKQKREKPATKRK
jgi:hypothetical protein